MEAVIPEYHVLGAVEAVAHLAWKNLSVNLEKMEMSLYKSYCDYIRVKLPESLDFTYDSTKLMPSRGEESQDGKSIRVSVGTEEILLEIGFFHQHAHTHSILEDMFGEIEAMVRDYIEEKWVVSYLFNTKGELQSIRYSALEGVLVPKPNAEQLVVRSYKSSFDFGEIPKNSNRN